MSNQERIQLLEQQVKLLWEVLYQLPSLEGLLDTILIEAADHEIRPMRFHHSLKIEKASVDP